MTSKELLRQAQHLSVDQRLRLAKAIHDSAQAEAASEPLTAWQIEELESRLEEDDRDPDDVVPWDEARAKLADIALKRR